ALLEAMACGKPVVGANSTAIPESVRDGKNGFLFTPGSEGDCAEKITRVLTMGARERKRMGGNARKTACEFSIPKSTAKLEKVYEKML
ncbi:MAG: glycosyltransferase family 4 protein, partial [Candidatus Micrarchaeota archaeon]